MVKLTGEIIWTSGMYISCIYQGKSGKFYLVETSEMNSDDPNPEEFQNLQAAVNEMFSHT